MSADKTKPLMIPVLVRAEITPELLRDVAVEAIELAERVWEKKWGSPQNLGDASKTNITILATKLLDKMRRGASTEHLENTAVVALEAAQLALGMKWGNPRNLGDERKTQITIMAIRLLDF